MKRFQRRDQLAPDEDDWTPNMPAHLSGWLYSIMKAFDFAFPPSVILEEEERYPGVWEDLFLHVWQDRLVEKQNGK